VTREECLETARTLGTLLAKYSLDSPICVSVQQLLKHVTEERHRLNVAQDESARLKSLLRECQAHLDFSISFEPLCQKIEEALRD
jgi:hypothetical protein